MLMELKVGVVCDRGLNRRRPVNQDRYLSLPQYGLFAVFDGVGGQQAGEVASQTAADTIEEALQHNSGSFSAESVQKAVEFANRDIYELANSNPSYKTMATTVALIHLDGGKATIAHVGDSRVYRLEKGKLHRETIDHTDLDDAVRSGVITEEQAAGFEESHVINRALGMAPDVEVELKTVKIHDGARFLLCTDGVYRMVTDEEITGLLSDSADPGEIAARIKALVHSRGADDNLTAVVVQAGRAKARTKSAAVGAKRTGGSPESKALHPAVSSARVDATMAEAARRPGNAGDADSRIRVHLKEPFAGDRSSEGRSEHSEHDDAESGPRSSAIVMYALIGLALLVGAFYAGLRLSDWNAKTNAATAARNKPPDPLESGRAQFQRGDYPAAAATFAAVAEQQPQNAQARYWLGRTEMAQHQFSDAAKSFEQAAAIQPGLPNALIEAAGAYEAAGNRTKAIEMLQRYKEELKN